MLFLTGAALAVGAGFAFAELAAATVAEEALDVRVAFSDADAAVACSGTGAMVGAAAEAS